MADRTAFPNQLVSFTVQAFGGGGSPELVTLLSGTLTIGAGSPITATINGAALEATIPAGQMLGATTFAWAWVQIVASVTSSQSVSYPVTIVTAPAYATDTAQGIVNYVETILQQTSDMIVAGLPSGGGENDNYTIDSNTQLLLWITEGFDRLARLCVPIYDTATVTVAAAGQAILGPNSRVISAAGRILHSPSQVFIGTRELDAANMGFLNSNGNFYPMTPNGEPTGWANNNSAIALSDYITTPTFTIPGYYRPAPITAIGQAVDPFFDDYAQRTNAFYVSWMVAQKNQDNSVFASRIAPCASEFITGVKEIYSRLISNDPTLPALFPPAPIDAMVQIMKQSSPKT